MNIVLCIKQVPDTADVKWTENNTLSREGAESVVNPCDYYAAETVLRIKDLNNSKITAISMGPLQAKTALKEIIAMGADEAYLLSDKYFAGSDTASTARVLTAAIKTKNVDFDLIVCGQNASDGDTAQTGPSLAQNLNIPVVSNVTEIEQINETNIIVRKKTDFGFERIEIELPALICITQCNIAIRLPKIAGRMKAQDSNIAVYNADDISLKADLIGFKGSPTYVKKAFKPQGRTDITLYKDKSPNEAAEFLLKQIEEYCKG